MLIRLRVINIHVHVYVAITLVLSVAPPLTTLAELRGTWLREGREGGRSVITGNKPGSVILWRRPCGGEAAVTFLG